MRTFTGGISLSPPLNMLKNKLMIDQKEVLSFYPTMVFIPLVQHIGGPLKSIIDCPDHYMDCIQDCTWKKALSD